MKIFYSITLLLQLVPAIFSRDRNKISYLLYVLNHAWGHGMVAPHETSGSRIILENHKYHTGEDELAFLLER